MDTFYYRAQPLKTLYTLFRLLSLVILYPYWTLVALLPHQRPRSTWGIRQVCENGFLQLVSELLLATGLPPQEAYADGKESYQGYAEVPSLPDKLLVGEIRKMATANGVSPAQIWGYWYDSDGVAAGAEPLLGESDKIVLYFHAGSLIMGSAVPSGPNALLTPHISKGLLKHGAKRVFAVEYRLASTHPFPSRNPFPAALIDALSAYHYLVGVLGISPKNIIVSGESAGTVLALSLARYTSQYNLGPLPPPVGAILFCPSADWGPVDWNGSMKRNANSDFSVVYYGSYAPKAMLGKLPSGDAATNSWLSPASPFLVPSKGIFSVLKSKVCIIAGEAECRIDSIRLLNQRLVGDLGKDKVLYVEIFGATHCFCTMKSFVNERNEAFKAVKAWLNTL